MSNKTIGVIVIAYNQENVIGHTLDTLLKQREWGLKEVLVGDDCSHDNTWERLLEYKKLFPDIVVPVRNEKNLGIYGNLENLLHKRSPSDLFFVMAGDDPICDGYLESIQKLIIKEHIDTKEAIGIISDWKIVRHTGKEKVFKQDLAMKGYRLESLLIRLKIYNRSLVVSQKVVDQFEPNVLDKGLRLAEMINEIRAFRHINRMYYLPMVTSTYYTGIGISTKLSVGKSDYYTKQSIIQWNYFKEHYAVNKRDLYYMDFELNKALFLESPSWKKYFMMSYYYLRGIIPGANNSIIKIGMLFWSLLKYKISFNRS